MARPRIIDDALQPIPDPESQGGAGDDMGVNFNPGGPIDIPAPGWSNDRGPIVEDDFMPQRDSESPRDRATAKGPGGTKRRPAPPMPGAPRSTPTRPKVPTPTAGSTQPGPGGESEGSTEGGPIVSPPLGSPVVGGNARLRSAGLMGAGGGLLGGGLGVPFDPVADEKSFDIDTLIKLLGGQ